MEKIVLNCELPDEDKQIKLVRKNRLVQELYWQMVLEAREKSCCHMLWQVLRELKNVV